MTSPEHHVLAVELAVEELASRLKALGARDPQEAARLFIQGLLRDGWRPRNVSTAPPPRPLYSVPPSEDFRAARALIRRNRPTEPEPTKDVPA